MGALFFLPFLGRVPLFDWDEINFAELAREMVVTGDWLQLQINYQRFTEKPPLFFWLQALSFKIWGVGEYGARFPNALLGTLVLPFLYVSGKFMISRSFGFFWALSWFGSVLPFLYFKSGIIDPFFNFFIFNGIFFAIQYMWQKRRFPNLYFSRKALTYLIISGLSLGLAVLTKGPVAYLLFFLTLLVYTLFNGFHNYLPWRSFLRHGFIVLSVFSLWLAVDWAMHGPDFLVEFIIRQWELLVNEDAGHGGFPGYHLVVLLIGCFPASLFALRGMGYIQGLNGHMRDFQKWMITLLVVVLVLFSLVNTKIVHYSSLAYYPISFLSALTLRELWEGRARAPRWLLPVLFSLGFVFCIVSAALPYLGMHKELLLRLTANDPLARATLSAPVRWSAVDYLPALWLLLVLLAFALLWRLRQRVATRVLFLGTGVWAMLALIFFVGKVERYSQRANVNFFRSRVGEVGYVTTYGYKSYVPWFYARVRPYAHPQGRRRSWLLSGKASQPVYISTKVNKQARLEKELPRAVWLYCENGFCFYRLDPLR